MSDFLGFPPGHFTVCGPMHFVGSYLDLIGKSTIDVNAERHVRQGSQQWKCVYATGPRNYHSDQEKCCENASQGNPVFMNGGLLGELVSKFE
jgi:hypothetical protein